MKGDIFNLYQFTAKLLEPLYKANELEDEQVRQVADIIDNNPFVIFLLLNKIECDMLLHDLGPENTIDDQEYSADVKYLKFIQSREPINMAYRCIAMVYSIMISLDHFTGVIWDVWSSGDEEESQTDLQKRLFKIAEDAISLAKEAGDEFAKQYKKILDFTTAHLNDLFGNTERGAAVVAMRDPANVVDFNELYMSLWMLIKVKEGAIQIESANSLWLVNHIVEENKTHGDWGRLLVSGWWSRERLELWGTPIWREVCAYEHESTSRKKVS